MTDENPRVSRPTSDAEDTAAPGRHPSPLASVFPWRRREAVGPAEGRHAADPDGAAGNEDDGSRTEEMALDGDPDGPSADTWDDDEEWDEQPAPPVKSAGRRRIPPVTAALAIAILVGLGFLGGVLVQKNHDEKYTASSAGGGLPALPEGFDPAALFGGGGRARSGSAGTSSTSASPIVIGEVVSVGRTSIVVRNISGKEITVALGATRTYEKASSAPIASLKAGTNVVVSGSTAADGTATASAITTR